MAHTLSHSIEDIIRPIKKPPKIRSDHDIFLIQEATQDIPFFAKYIAEGHAEVHLKCCKHITYEMFEQNQFVFEAGDNGSKFYVILDGKVGVYIKVKTQQKRVKELQKGESFGELALVNDAPRSASIKCLTDCHFAVLDKKNYVTLFQQIIDEEVKREVSFYPEIELFRSWNYNKIKSFYTSSFRLKVKKGDRIITEQEHLDAIYIIVSGEFVVKHKTSSNQKRNDIQSLRRHSMNQIMKANSEMSLFIMSKYEIFGQESAQADDPKFEFSVECQSYDGNLIYIKSQDYLRIILSDAAQETYMSKYSASRLKRVEERIKEVSQTLQFQNDSKPIVVETLVPQINLLSKSPNNANINNSFNHRGDNDKNEESSVSQKNLYPHAPSLSHSRSQLHSNSEIGSFNEIKQNFSSIENKPTIGEMHLLAQRSFVKLEPLNCHSENTPDNSKHHIISDHLLSPSRHHHNLQLHPLKQKSSIFEMEQQQSPAKNFIPSLSSLDQESPTIKSNSEKHKGILHLHHSSTSKQQSPVNLSNKHSSNHNYFNEDSFTKDLIISDKNVQFSNELKQDSQMLSSKPQEEKEQQDTQHTNHIRFSKETSILNSDQESLGQVSPKKWLRINLKIVNKDSPNNPKKSKKNSPRNNIESIDEEQLHPLVKAFHDQLKIRYYSKFKNGQIEDLKHHLNYQPIQSLHVGKNENGSQRSQEPTIFSSKKIKEKRLKDLREYELKLQSIIKNDHSSNTTPIQSISPLDLKSLQKNSNNNSKQGQNIPELPQLHSSSRSASGDKQSDRKNAAQISQESEYQLYQTDNQNSSLFLKQTIKHQRSQSSSLMPKDESNSSTQNNVFFPKGIHVRDGRTMFNQNISNIFQNSRQDHNYFQNSIYNKSPNKSMKDLGINSQNTSLSHGKPQNYSQADLAKSFAYFHQPYSSNNPIFKGTFPNHGSSATSYLNLQQQTQLFKSPTLPQDYNQQSNQTSGISPPLGKSELFNKFHSLTASPSSSSFELTKQNSKNLNFQNKNISREISMEKDNLNIQEAFSYPHIVESVSQVNLSNSNKNNITTNSYFNKKRNKFFAIMPVSMENYDTSQKSVIIPISNYSKQLKAGFKGSQGFNCSQFNLRKDKATYYSQN